MAKLTIEIDDELHKKLKVKAAQKGLSMKELLVECIQKMT
jgi:plasmid stability protein